MNICSSPLPRPCNFQKFDHIWVKDIQNAPLWRGNSHRLSSGEQILQNAAKGLIPSPSSINPSWKGHCHSSSPFFPPYMCHSVSFLLLGKPSGTLILGVSCQFCVMNKSAGFPRATVWAYPCLCPFYFCFSKSAITSKACFGK